MQQLPNASTGHIVLSLADTIVANKAYLSEIDGKIGDGDHGVNMAKGFAMASERIKGNDMSLAAAFETLGTVLMSEIGGSMGPLYGIMFLQFAEAIETKDPVDAKAFGAMLDSGRSGIETIGSAKVGDKTLLDALVPAIDAFHQADADGKSFSEALDAMVVAAEKGRDGTKDLVAKVGRASRLGERSLGVLDAGATSCTLILGTLAQGAKRSMQPSP